MTRIGTHSVYVIELDREVLKERKFVEENPQHDPDKACLYVGVTGLDPEERFENHQRGHKASKWVRKYGECLRPDLFEEYDPMSYDEAAKKEVELAEDLRAKGHAVWQN